MKVKILSRNPDTYLRETKLDIHKVPRNYDPTLHPFEVPREYVRALNATKLERVFAKPFVGNLDGHKEGVSCIGKHPTRLSLLLSGAYDGEVKLWDLPRKVCVRTVQAHEGFIRGLCFLPDGDHFVTIGDDKSIKVWETELDYGQVVEPTDTFFSRTTVSCISHHQTEPLFATGGEICQIWEETRSEPIKTFQWGVDSQHDIAYNPVQTNILASCTSNNCIIFYDSRESGPLRKLKMTLRVNKLAWNPMEAFIFTCASEDYNLYTFDSRYLKTAVNVHQDHVEAVTCLDYSPTGREFVSGSYDKSIRVFEVNKGHSRDIYHTKRMQRVTCVAWSLDAKFLISGSDEMNLRLWKSQAAAPLGILKPRQKAALNANEALKAKFAAHPLVSRIRRHRQLPRHLYAAKLQLRAARDKVKRKESNRRLHSKPGTVPYVPERRKPIVDEQE